MLKQFASIIAAAALLTACGTTARTTADTDNDPVRWVNPFMGTGGIGMVYPGAQVPFGMVQLSPDIGLSGYERIPGYFYYDTTIASFSHTHLSGTGCGDLYDLMFMPAVPPFKQTKELGIYSTFDHENESAEPGYYRVLLKDYGINVELTSTERSGLQRYTFPATDQATVILNLEKALNWDYSTGSEIKVINERTIAGHRFSSGWAPDQKLYFITEFSQPFTGHNIEKKLTRHRDPRYNGLENQIGTFVFDTRDQKQVLVRTAISAVSIEGAMKNLRAELDSWDFDSVRSAARNNWNEKLSRVKIEGGDDEQRAIFYTSLYRSMLAPTIFGDVDGRYFGPDKQVHQADGWTNYTLFSLWDTYRAAQPLFMLTNPEKVADMVNSFIAFYEQSGSVPVWNLWGEETDMMIGYHSVPVIAEAYLKGIKGFDPERALAACVGTANRDNYRGIGDYKKLGYIPADREGESLSKTLEYTYDDFCIAMMAKKMGKEDVYQEFMKRANFYKNLYNPDSRFFEPRKADGSWLGGFDPEAYTHHITESNAWHYRYAAQHDIAGIRELLGGKKELEVALDSMFSLAPTDPSKLPSFSTGMIGQYAHGNEPSHHIAYLYDWTDNPARTQELVTEIMRTQYLDLPEGLCGNEDCGQMSAWYVFSAIGFYPVDAVSMEYALGVPLFEKSTITLPNGKIFETVAKGISAERYLVDKFLLNGKEIDRPFVTWEQIMAGGTLEFVLK